MRIVIVGAGRTGTQLARQLIREKHDISLIESNEERARHASNRLDCMVLHDEGNSLAALEDAGIARAEALVCVTDSDEMNMIICGLAASRYPELIKIARVRNDDYVRLNQQALDHGSADRKSADQKSVDNMSAPKQKILGIDYFIHPDVEAARAALRALAHGALGDILDFAGTSYELGSIDVAQGSTFDGLLIKDFHSVVKESSLVPLVERDTGSAVECILPDGSTALKKGDRVYILAREDRIEEIFRMAGRYEKPLRHIGIVGGGRVGTLLLEGLLHYPGSGGDSKGKKGGLFSMFHSIVPKSNRRVVMVEQDYAVCKELAARFPEALILNQDISDESFIAEERLGDLDLIITATANQELNIIAAIYLKSRGVRRAIALVSGSGYGTIARQLGVDVVIPMQSVVVDSILSNLMGKVIRGVHRLGDATLSILELEIREDSPAVKKAITEFKLSEGGLVILVNRGDTSFIPRGDYVFEAADKIILIAKNGSEAELEKFFGKEK